MHFGSMDFKVRFTSFITEKVRRHNTFLVLGKSYRYFDTVKTWHGERAVEIPIVMEARCAVIGECSSSS